MEALEEQIIIKATDEEITASKDGIKSRNPGLRALLSIKEFTATLEKDNNELLRIEGELAELNKNGLSIFEANSPPEATAEWAAVLKEINEAVIGINDTLNTGKEMIAQKEKEGYPNIWKQLAAHLNALKANSKNAVDKGWMLLPEAVHPQWEKEFAKLETPLVESLVANVESCRVLLQMIERYTPDELNAITQIIVDHIPLDFTYEEAVEYQKDYHKALVDFKKEFKEEKNLWDKFLDILAGGVHQSPSERVMMERWVDGEKGNL